MIYTDEADWRTPLQQGPDSWPSPALTALLDNGTPQPVISHLLPLEAAAEAHRILETRHTGGRSSSTSQAARAGRLPEFGDLHARRRVCRMAMD